MHIHCSRWVDNGRGSGISVVASGDCAHYLLNKLDPAALINGVLEPGDVLLN